MKKKHLVLYSLSTILPLGIVGTVVSCNNDKDTNINNGILGPSFLSDQDVKNFQQNLTLKNTYQDQLMSADLLWIQKKDLLSDQLQIGTVLGEYTNINNSIIALQAKDIIVRFNKAWLPYNASTIMISVTFSKGNEIYTAQYSIKGFVTTDVNMNLILDNAIKKLIEKNPTASQTSTGLTSEEIFDQWYDTLDIYKNRFLFRNINLDGLYELSNGQFEFEGTKLSVETNFKNKEEALNYVQWNPKDNIDDPDDNNIKGTTLKIKLNFSVEREVENNKIIKNKEYDLEVKGFLSFNNKFNNLCKEYVDLKGGINVNSIYSLTQSATVIINDYNSATTEDEKNRVINNCFVFPTTPISSLSFEIQGLKHSTLNPSAIVVVSKLSWNGLEKIVDIEYTGFLTDDSLFNQAIKSLNDLILRPTDIGAEKSSQTVYDEYNIDINTLSKNVDNLPQNNNSFTYEIKNIDWNSDADDVNRGSTLYINIEMTYKISGSEVKKADVRKIVQGFLSPYQGYLNQWNEKIKNLDLTLTQAARNEVAHPDYVNESNWTKYITGIEINREYRCSNFSFDYSDGANGSLTISFLYSWQTGDPYNFVFYTQITKTFDGFEKYNNKANNNYIDILNIWTSNTNYLDKIQVSGTRKSDYLSSYFAVDAKNSNGFDINIFKKLWNIPTDKFGIKIEIVSCTYYGNDVVLGREGYIYGGKITANSLKVGTTSLRIELRLKSLYQEDKQTTKEWVVNGFYDPWNDEFYKQMSNQYNNIMDYNDSTYKKWHDVPKTFAIDQYGTWQNIATHWWEQNLYEKLGKRQKEYITEVKKILTERLVGFMESSKKVYRDIVSVDFIDQSVKQRWRTGVKDTDGCLVLGSKVKFSYKTYAVDNKGNSASGKFSEYDYVVGNQYVWLYERDGWWGS